MPSLLCCFTPKSKSAKSAMRNKKKPKRATMTRGTELSRPLPDRTPSSARHQFSLETSSNNTFDAAAFLKQQRDVKAQLEAEQAESERQASTRAAQAAARQNPELVATARRLITGNMQLSANRPAVLREFDYLLRSDEEGTPEELAYKAMNNVMETLNGSDNAVREAYGGYLRR